QGIDVDSLLAASRPLEHVLDLVGDRAHVVHADDARIALDRVHVAEQRVHELAAVARGLEREQALLDAVEPLLGLVAEDLQDLGRQAHRATTSSSSASTRTAATSTPSTTAAPSSAAPSTLTVGGGSEPTPTISSTAMPASPACPSTTTMRDAASPRGTSIAVARSSTGSTRPRRLRTPRTAPPAPGTGVTSSSSATSRTCAIGNAYRSRPTRTWTCTSDPDRGEPVAVRRRRRLARLQPVAGEQPLELGRRAADAVGELRAALAFLGQLLGGAADLDHRVRDLAGRLLLLLGDLGALVERVEDVRHQGVDLLRLLGALLGGEDRRVRLVLDAGDDRADRVGRLDAALGELAHLAGDDREAAARLAGAGGLDRGVEREQVGLLGDLVDQAEDLADLL